MVLGFGPMIAGFNEKVAGLNFQLCKYDLWLQKSWICFILKTNKSEFKDQEELKYAKSGNGLLLF